MSGNDTAREILEAFAGYTDAPASGGESSATRPLRLGTVTSGYSGSGAASVIFDGETVAGARTYLPLAPVAASTHVVLMPVGSTYVIAGSVDGILGARLSDAETAITDLQSLVPVRRRIPSSVAVSAGSASVAAGGVVTFTGAGIVKLNGVFRAGHRYRVIFTDITGATAGSLYCALQVGGSIVGGAQWTGGTWYRQGGSSGSFYTSAAANTPAIGYASTASPSDLELEIVRPFESCPHISVLRSAHSGTDVWGSYTHTSGSALNADGFWFQGIYALSGKIQVLELL